MVFWLSKKEMVVAVISASWGAVKAIALYIKPLRFFWLEPPLLNDDCHIFKPPWHGGVVI
jgi:hypothetical protein